MPTMSNRIRRRCLFTDPRTNEIGKVEGKTRKFHNVLADGDSYPRRMEIGPDGNLFRRYRRQDVAVQPQDTDFKEFPLPGPVPSPYALVLMLTILLVYSTTWTSLGALTEDRKVIEYPVPALGTRHAGILPRFPRPDWYGSARTTRSAYFICRQNGAAGSASK